MSIQEPFIESKSGSLGGPGRSCSLPIVDQHEGRIRLTPRRSRRFRPEAPLGTGGTGEVVRAADLDIGRPVAIKRLRPDRHHDSDVARFVREIQLVGNLEHPNIVPLHDVGTDDHDSLYAVMKYVDGETLADLIERLREGEAEAHARWDFTARTRLFLEICRGIAFAHDSDVLHRDIKPGNVMVGPEGEAQILDWGLAKRRDGVELIDEGDRPTDPRGTAVSTWAPDGRPSAGSGDFDTRAGAVFGTPAYMSPEQARGGPFDERSEVFALGLLFWEFLTLGDPLPLPDPALGQVAAARDRVVPHPSTARVHPAQGAVPMHLAWLVHQATRPDPAERFASVGELIERLRALSDGVFPVQCPTTLQRRMLAVATRFADRRPMTLMATTMAMIGGLVGMGVAIGLAW